MDATADLLLYGNAELAPSLKWPTPPVTRRTHQHDYRRARHCLHPSRPPPEAEGWLEIDSTRVDQPGKVDRIINPYLNTTDMDECELEKRNQQWLEYEDHGSIKRPGEQSYTSTRAPGWTAIAP
ncbi:MAG: hypothetical protein R3E95_14460 [Thiolinea sp.]